MGGSSFPRGEQEGASPAAHRRLQDTLEDVLNALDPVSATSPARAGAALCRMLAGVVDAPAAAHIRYDSRQRTARMMLWRRRSPTDAVVLDQQEPAGPRAAVDWWTASRARGVLFDSLAQRHLAELPMDPDPEAPSLLVVGRAVPFSERDSRRIAAEHRSLRIVERIVERLAQRLAERLAERLPGAPGTMLPIGSGTASGTHRLTQERPLQLPAQLTAREQEVLEMLGEGLLARSIAQRLAVSERTVHKHLGSVYRKLDAHDRLLAVRRAEALGLLPAGSAARW